LFEDGCGTVSGTMGTEQSAQARLSQDVASQNAMQNDSAQEATQSQTAPQHAASLVEAKHRQQQVPPALDDRSLDDAGPPRIPSHDTASTTASTDGASPKLKLCELLSMDPQSPLPTKFNPNALSFEPKSKEVSAKLNAGASTFEPGACEFVSTTKGRFRPGIQSALPPTTGSKDSPRTQILAMCGAFGALANSGTPPHPPPPPPPPLTPPSKSKARAPGPLFTPPPATGPSKSLREAVQRQARVLARTPEPSSKQQAAGLQLATGLQPSFAPPDYSQLPAWPTSPQTAPGMWNGQELALAAQQAAATGQTVPDWLLPVHQLATQTFEPQATLSGHPMPGWLQSSAPVQEPQLSLDQYFAATHAPPGNFATAYAW